MKNTFKLRICPYCGHHGQKLVSEQGERTKYQVECQCCGAKGPIEFKVEDALWSWNLRHTRPAHDDDQEKIEFIYETESEKE